MSITWDEDNMSWHCGNCSANICAGIPQVRGFFIFSILFAITLYRLIYFYLSFRKRCFITDKVISGVQLIQQLQFCSLNLKTWLNHKWCENLQFIWNRKRSQFLYFHWNKFSFDNIGTVFDNIHFRIQWNSMIQLFYEWLKI